MKSVFIGGCDRSGTTLLAAALAKKKGFYTTPESQFKTLGGGALRSNNSVDPVVAKRLWGSSFRFRIWDIDDRKVDWSRRSLPSLMLSLNSLYYQVDESYIRDMIWVDHTPNNLKHYLYLKSNFERPVFLHIVRDGRAVFSSVKKLSWGPFTATFAARWWLERLAPGLSAEAAGCGDVIMVRYEDLVSDPDEVVNSLAKRLYRHFELDSMSAPDKVLNFQIPGYTSGQHSLLVGDEVKVLNRSASWRGVLSDEEVRKFESIAGGVLANLGYQVEFLKMDTESNISAIDIVFEVLNRFRNLFSKRRVK